MFCGYFVNSELMQPIQFVQVNAPTEIRFQASDSSGKILLFRNAILARAETNLNNDEIDSQGIDELATSISGKPIDVEHRHKDILGVFTDARPVENSTALSVDGLIWADRYPDEAKEVQDGKMLLSVEASAKKAKCSACGGEFESSDSYCACLRARKVYGARRKLTGLTGEGGGVTRKPAGTDTRFDKAQICFVASHDEDDSLRDTPATIAIDAKESEMADIQKPTEGTPAEDAEKKDLNAKAAEATEACNRAKAELEASQAKVGELETEIAKLKANLEAKENEVQAAVQNANELKVTLRRNSLKAMADEEWEKNKETITSLSDAQFNLLAASLNRAPLAAQGGAGIVPPDPKPAKKPLTLRKE